MSGLPGKTAAPAETGKARRGEAALREERALLERCRAGDRMAFDDLIRAYECRVFNFAYRLCGNYDEANDLASETFVRLYSSLRSFRGEASFTTWLFRIVTNVYLDQKKKKRSRPVESLDEMLALEESEVARQIVDPAPTPPQHAELHERSQLLQQAILQLPGYQRAMILMYHVEGRSYEEIAESLELPMGTVKSRLNRARQALRELLEPVQEHFRI